MWPPPQPLPTRRARRASPRPIPLRRRPRISKESVCSSIATGAFISATPGTNPRISNSAATRNPLRLSPPLATLARLRATFDDSAWQKVDLLDDWAVDLPFVNAPALVAHGCKPLGRAYPETSIGWYRRVFDLPAADLGRRVSLEFDGVFRQSMVIFNGHYLGEQFSGYALLHYDATDYVMSAAPGMSSWSVPTPL